MQNIYKIIVQHNPSSKVLGITHLIIYNDNT